MNRTYGWPLLVPLLLAGAALPGGARAELQCGIKQVTNGNAFGVSVGYPSMTADGTRIAYQSPGDPVGENKDGNVEVFLYDDRTATTRQITHTTGFRSDRLRPSISGDGARIVFASDQDITGQNADHVRFERQDQDRRLAG